MSEAHHKSWSILVRSALLVATAWSLADGVRQGAFADDDVRPTRRAAPGPLPLPWTPQPAVLPRGAPPSPEPEGRRAAGSPAASTIRAARDLLPAPPGGRLVESAWSGRTARLLLFVAPKHGPPAVA